MNLLYFDIFLNIRHKPESLTMRARRKTTLIQIYFSCMVKLVCDVKYVTLHPTQCSSCDFKQHVFTLKAP